MHSGPAASVSRKGQSPPPLIAVAECTGDDKDRDLEGTVALDDGELTGANRRLHDSKNSCRTEKRVFLGTVAQTFQFASELVGQEAFADAGLSDELLSVKCALSSAQVEA